MKAAVLSFCLAGGCLFAPLEAVTITVTVTCSNGQSVNSLPIRVVDSVGTEVPDVTETDSQGVFEIANSETFTAPFHIFFNEPNGSTCGSCGVVTISSTTGFVTINYYPTELPCSCANLN